MVLVFKSVYYSLLVRSCIIVCMFECVECQGMYCFNFARCARLIRSDAEWFYCLQVFIIVSLCARV